MVAVLAVAMQAALAVAGADDPLFVWRPNPGPQERFVSCNADEILYGGAAGGGKSDGLLAGVTRWIGHPQFRALILRRTIPELKKSLYDRARELYQGIDRGAKFNETDREWEFSTKAKLFFGHAEHEHSVHQYQGAAFQYIGFDELTHFTLKQYLYLFTRARSAHGIPVRIRSTANPGGEGHEWVFARWRPWLDRRPDYIGPRAESGEVLWFLPSAEADGPERWLSGGKSEAFALLEAWNVLPPEQQQRTPRPMSRTFIGAKLSDNPALMQNDPGYADRIRAQDAVTRRRLLDGDWLVQSAAGAYFQRAWFKWLDERPRDAVATLRRWDLASTEDGGDWTVGVRMTRPRGSGLWVIDDVVRVRLRPEGVKRTVLATAAMDGKGTRVVMSQDPGQAGKAQVEDYARELAGYDVRFERETGDKVTRAQPFSAQCEAGNVALVRAPWNEPFLQSLEAFPDPGVHDDDVDAASGAFSAMQDVVDVDSYIAAIRKAAK
jgi:predicted phage terminase large subunit-like protein